MDLTVLSDRGAFHAPRNQAPQNRAVWFEGGWQDTPVYQRGSVPPEFEGPAIIEQFDCTTVLEPGNVARVDALGNLLVEV
jgi:N-methylhydantoinase A